MLYSVMLRKLAHHGRTGFIQSCTVFFSLFIHFAFFLPQPARSLSVHACIYILFVSVFTVLRVECEKDSNSVQLLF